MSRTDLLKGVGAFALVVVVVLAATAATGVLLSGSPQSSDVDAPAYDADLRPTAVDDDGSVAAPDGGETKTVVVDQSHGNGVGERDLEPLVDALIEAGHDVRFYTGGDSSGGFGGGMSSGGGGLNATLQSADALVVANPASEYTDSEIDGIAAFADAGGRLLLLADPVPPSAGGQSLPIDVPAGVQSGSAATPGQPTNLAARFGIAFGAGYLYDMADNANNFQRVYARPAGDGDLTAGVDRLVLDEAAPITTDDDATAIAESADVRRSETRRAGTYAVAARTGGVAAVGNTDFLSPSSATVADNEAFVGNLAAFLVNGDKRPGVPESSGGTDGPGGITDPSQPGSTPTFPGNGTSPLPGNGTSP
ncbi:hypothetical protein [Halorientalis halophila]|uniref:hypothetical protein n=1 Tax=Halorientalis halophila TaxID=3108499 RepID=UPI003009D4D1